jgi:hypothetical protein
MLMRKLLLLLLLVYSTWKLSGRGLVVAVDIPASSDRKPSLMRTGWGSPHWVPSG